MDEDAQLLASMGHNTIRLGLLWAGLEPVEGQYNMTYMEVTSALLTCSPVIPFIHCAGDHQVCGYSREVWYSHCAGHAPGREGIFLLYLSAKQTCRS